MKVWELIEKLMKVPAGYEVVGCVDGTLFAECLMAEHADTSEQFEISFADPQCVSSGGDELGSVTELIEFYEENAEQP